MLAKPTACYLISHSSVLGGVYSKASEICDSVDGQNPPPVGNHCIFHGIVSIYPSTVVSVEAYILVQRSK